MYIDNFKKSELLIKALINAKRFIVKAKEPVIDFALSTLRHYTKRLKGKTNV
jgi:hypothetical protein